MGDDRKGGKGNYNFDYFERMNHPNKETGAHQGTGQKSPAKHPKGPPPPRKKAPPQKPDSQGRRPHSAMEEQQRNPARPPGQRPRQEGMPGNSRPIQTGGPRPSRTGPYPKDRERPPQGNARPRQTPAGKRPPQKEPPPKKKKEKPYLTPEQRRKRRKKRLILFYISIFIAVVVTGLILSVTVLFKVDTIEVEGESRYSQEEILQTSQLEKGVNLFMMDTKSASDKIQKALPYVGSVKISRKLPGRIVIHVDDVIVAGGVKNAAGYLIIGANGRALEQVAALPQGVPSIVGVNLKDVEIGDLIQYGDDSQKTLFEELTTALEENEFDKITQIDISDQYNVKVVYDGRISMEFGLPTDLPFKIQFAKSILGTGEILNTDKGVLDLSLATESDRVYFERDYTVSGTPSGASSQASGAASSASPASSSAASAPAA